MNTVRRHRVAFFACSSVALIVGGSVLVAAQPKPAARRTARAIAGTGKKVRQDQQKVQAERRFAFGDVMLRNWATMTGDFKTVRIVGPSVTVDSDDPKTGAVTHMTALEFLATRSKGGGVDKIDAVGAVKFSGVRPATGRKGMQTFDGSGSKGTYFKQAGRLELEGPVNYYVEQPASSGVGKQWVRGTADHAEYDEAKKILILTGHVRAKAADPDALDEDKPSDILCDEATLDFSTPTVTFKFNNLVPTTGAVTINPKVEPRKEPVKPPKKDRP
jgi:lipopolysaccharide export system protein LptA